MHTGETHSFPDSSTMSLNSPILYCCYCCLICPNISVAYEYCVIFPFSRMISIYIKVMRSMNRMFTSIFTFPNCFLTSPPTPYKLPLLSAIFLCRPSSLSISFFLILNSYLFNSHIALDFGQCIQLDTLIFVHVGNSIHLSI